MNPLDQPNLLNLPQLADLTSLPVSAARYYRDRFILFVPCVRIGRAILHPPEAVEVVRVIRDLAATGKDARAIEATLYEQYPVTVVNAQPIEPGGVQIGHAAAFRAVATAIDARGARLEADVAGIREELAAIASHSTLAEVERLRPALEAAVGELGDLKHVAATIDGLQVQLGQIASREQLEWIGDVVAAAALRPPQAAMDAAIERRLRELHVELQRVQGRDESDTRAALERLTEQLTSQKNRRDQEIQRALQTLVAAMRHEFAGMHAGIAELKDSMSTISVASHAMNGFDSHGSHSNGAYPGSTEVPEAGNWDPVQQTVHTEDVVDRSRAPRRLGPPLKPHGAPLAEEDLAQEMA